MLYFHWNNIQKSPEALQPKLTKAPAISTLTNLYLSPRLFLDNIPYKIK